jgi:threonine/homoserine/homoserine lactone efflux protein
MLILISGIIIGFLVAAPVGPTGILVINRTLKSGKKIGFISGIGAALADTLYASFVSFSISIIINFLFNNQELIQATGSVFLAIVGYKTIRTVPKEKGKVSDHNYLITTFFLTLTNPLTLLAFIGIFASFGTAIYCREFTGAILLITGVFCGSCSWWFLLTIIVNRFKERMNEHVEILINRISGIIMILFGIASLINAAVKILT